MVGAQIWVRLITEKRLAEASQFHCCFSHHDVWLPATCYWL